MIFYYLFSMIYDKEPKKKVYLESASQKPDYRYPSYYDVEKGYPNCFVINVRYFNN